MIIPISIVIPYRKNNSDISVWLQKRNSNDKISGLLEFPGGKIEKDETPEIAACREIAEETGVNVEKGRLLKFKNYDFPTPNGETLLLMVFLYPDETQKFKPDGHISLQKLARMKDKILPNNGKIIVDLIEYFR